MKVLFLTRKWLPAVGGMEVYCHELVQELRQRVDLELHACPGRADGRPPSLFSLVTFGIATAFALLRNGTRADIVHGGDMAMWPLVWLATLRSNTVQPVLSAHGTDIALAHRRSVRAWLYARYLKACAALLPSVTVLANSRATARLCEGSGFSSVKVIPLATRVRNHDIHAPEPYVLFVGRLIPRKGGAWFIEHVLPLLDQRLKLVVVGVVWDPAEELALHNPRVTFRGPTNGAELARLRAQATVIVVPNLAMGPDGFEGFGLTAIEGAADNGVVLAARVDGLIDAVRDGESGFLLPAGQPERWAEKINEIRNWSSIQRCAFIDHARATVTSIYSWARVANETIAAYGTPCWRQ